jgi:hypothetical protein
MTDAPAPVPLSAQHPLGPVFVRSLSGPARVLNTFS